MILSCATGLLVRELALGKILVPHPVYHAGTNFLYIFFGCFYSDNFARQIEAISFDPRLTNHADALRKSREMLQGSDRSKFVIIFTDGMTNEEQGEEARIADQMRNQDGIVIIAFG